MFTFPVDMTRSFKGLTGGETVFLLLLKPLVALKILCSVFREFLLELSEWAVVVRAWPLLWYFITETGETILPGCTESD